MILSPRELQFCVQLLDARSRSSRDISRIGKKHRNFQISYFFIFEFPSPGLVTARFFIMGLFCVPLLHSSFRIYDTVVSCEVLLSTV